MFRNQYDTDVTTFSPAGRLHQVEYAMEAVKQGSCSVGVRTSGWVVIGSLKRSSSELAAYQQKVFKVDDSCGIAISGLIADARVLAQYMRGEMINHRYVFSSPMQTERLVIKLSDKSQVYTQKAEKRPYGVGLLVAGVDQTGPHLFQTDPSGVYFDCVAAAIGARAQSAKTYLERVYDSLDGLSREELIEHVLRALKGASVKKLTSRNVSLGVVGLQSDFSLLEGDDVRSFVGRVTNEDDEDETEEEEKRKRERREGGEPEEEKKGEDMQEEVEAKAAEEEQRAEEHTMQQQE
jgi:20S proteasome subunit alpha 6